MTAPIVGTTACIWCASPILLYKNNPYTRYCPRPKGCSSKNKEVLNTFLGKNKTVKHREKKARERERREEKGKVKK